MEKVMSDIITIISAAIKYNDLIFSLPIPARHHDILHKMYLPKDENGLELPKQKCEQGFLTSKGFFVNRIEAAKIANDCGQVESLILAPYLYSEDLW